METCDGQLSYTFYRWEGPGGGVRELENLSIVTQPVRVRIRTQTQSSHRTHASPPSLLPAQPSTGFGSDLLVVSIEGWTQDGVYPSCCLPDGLRGRHLQEGARLPVLPGWAPQISVSPPKSCQSRYQSAESRSRCSGWPSSTLLSWRCWPGCAVQSFSSSQLPPTPAQLRHCVDPGSDDRDCGFCDNLDRQGCSFPLHGPGQTYSRPTGFEDSVG